MTIESTELAELEQQDLEGSVITGNKLELVKGVKVQLRALLGSAELSVADLFDLRENSIVKLDALKDAPIDLLLDGKVVARGELVVADDNFGVQISQVIDL